MVRQNTNSLPGPGVYVNPVSVTGSLTVPTGIYIFEQGFAISGNPSATLSSAPGGVLFFIGTPNAPPSPAQTAAYSVSGNGTVNLSAMSTGTYKGIVVFQSRTDASPMSISGNGSSTTYNGLVYAPDAQVSTTGNGATTSSGIVAGSLVCGGNAAVTVGSPSSTITTIASSINPSTTGQSVTFTAQTTTVDGLTPKAGTVTFTETPNGSTPVTLCSGVSLNNGQTTCTTSALQGSGSPYAIGATYSGTANYLTSQGTLNQTVTPASTSTALTSNINPSTLNQAVTYTATVGVVAPGSGTASGSVEFTDNNIPVAGCGGMAGVALNGGTPDVATCMVTYTVGAIHTVTAQYLGNASFGGSTSTMLQSVGPTLSNFTEGAVGTQQETFAGNTNENAGTITVYVCSGTQTSCSAGSPTRVQTYTTTTFTGSGPSFAWSVSTNVADLTTGSKYTAQASQVDASAQPSVNAPTVQFTAN
jgi:hypothetical protein